MSIEKELILGTAMWGWSIPPERCHQLLERFYDAGHRWVDTATNYPIDKNPEHFRLAESILLEWVRAHGVHDLKIIVKVGSINNLFTPENNLSKSFLLLNLDHYANLFGENLRTFMIHWDNRNEEGPISETLEALAIASEKGLRPGLSGIRHPEIYARLNERFHLDFQIQLKHNPLQSDYPHYAPFHGSPCFQAYGLNAGGVKLRAQDYRADSSLRLRKGDAFFQNLSLEENFGKVIEDANKVLDRPRLSTFNHLGMIHAWEHPEIGWLLIGPSRMEQLDGSLHFVEQLKQFEWRDVYQALCELRPG